LKHYTRCRRSAAKNVIKANVWPEIPPGYPLRTPRARPVTAALDQLQNRPGFRGHDGLHDHLTVGMATVGHDRCLMHVEREILNRRCCFMAATPSFRLAFDDSKGTGRGGLSICVGSPGAFTISDLLIFRLLARPERRGSRPLSLTSFPRMNILRTVRRGGCHEETFGSGDRFVGCWICLCG
jgi:hypothetical protein